MGGLRHFTAAGRALARFLKYNSTIRSIPWEIFFATFSVVYNLLINPFPYKQFNRSVTFAIHGAPNWDSYRQNFPIPQFVAFREQNHVFEEMVGSYNWDVRYNDGTGTRQFIGAWMTTNGLQYYGVRPLLGRGFIPEDGKPGAPPVFAMNNRLWQSEFHGDPKVLGKSVVLNNKVRTLVGIMPPLFDAYFGAGLYLPLSLSPGSDEASFFGRPVSVFPMARLKTGVTLESAAADLKIIAQRDAEIEPKEYPAKFTVSTERIADYLVGKFKKTLYALLGAVFILLLIACSNVANLLLARATVREREIAIRASLGATRIRLIRQLLIESFVLAAGACLVGCGFAYFGMKLVSRIIPPGTVPVEVMIGLNPAVLLFAAAMASLTVLACGLAPALYAVRGDLQPRLSGSRRTSEELRGTELCVLAWLLLKWHSRLCC